MKYKLTNENFKNNYGEQLLRSRGVENVELFLNPNETCLQSPEALNNIEKGAELLHNVLMMKGRILLVVDSDCDGFTSAAIIYQYIKDICEDN